MLIQFSKFWAQNKYDSCCLLGLETLKYSWIILFFKFYSVHDVKWFQVLVHDTFVKLLETHQHPLKEVAGVQNCNTKLPKMLDLRIAYKLIFSKNQHRLIGSGPSEFDEFMELNLGCSYTNEKSFFFLDLEVLQLQFGRFNPFQTLHWYGKFKPNFIQSWSQCSQIYLFIYSVCNEKRN